MIKLSQLESHAEQQVADTDALLKDFGSDISSYANRPYILEWSIGCFEAAAKNFVFKKVLVQKGKRELSDEEAVTAMAEYVLTEVINGARWPKRSTSPVDCIMHECMTAAWANLYCLITGRM